MASKTKNEKLTEEQMLGLLDAARNHATQDSAALTGITDQLEDLIAEIAGETNAEAPLLCRLHMVRNACKETTRDLTALADSLDALL